MKRSILRNKIKRINDKYLKTSSKINNEYNELIKEINKFRMKTVNEVFNLKHKDKELNKLEKEYYK